MRGSPFVPIFFARLLRAHTAKEWDKVDRSNRSGFFREKKRLRFVTLNLIHEDFSFLLIPITYQHRFDHGASLLAAQRKRSRSSLYSNDEIFLDSSLQRLDDVGFERVSTVAGFFHR